MVIEPLRSTGLAPDGFGAGYSSLNHLHELPVDEVKIDRAFVATLDDPDRRAMVRLLETLNVRTVAEGVENARQLAYVGSMGIDACQGFHFSPPVTAGSLPAALRRCEVLVEDAMESAAAGAA